jgi:carbon storage regulator CsrA
MLVLSRRLNEKIVFPGLGITVQVVAVKPGVVRLGIEAPSAVSVFRQEILGQPAPDVTVLRQPPERG